MTSDERSTSSLQDATCVVCPAQVMELGEFDVSDRPGRGNRYDPEVGYRVDTATGAAVCVHPFRVGLPPGRYATGDEPLPGSDQPPPEPTAPALDLPSDVIDLEAWLIATLRVAPPSRMAAALQQAETLATQRFSTEDVIAAMRRVLTHELANR